MKKSEFDFLKGTPPNERVVKGEYKGKYPYFLKVGYTIDLKGYNIPDFKIKEHGWEGPIAKVLDGVLYIYYRYRWDGVTAFPDFSTLMEASMVHDVLLQAIYDHKVLDEKYIHTTHEIFREIGKEVANKQTKWLTRKTHLAIVSTAYGGLKVLHTPFHNLTS